MKYLAKLNIADKRVLLGLLVLALLAVGAIATLIVDKATFKPSASGVSATINLGQSDPLPAVLAVKQGTTVTWVNKATVERRIVSTPFPQHTDLPSLDSRQNISTGGSFSYTYTKKGTFGYVDYLHPEVAGKVIVE